jgi:hypothetical protein
VIVDHLVRIVHRSCLVARTKSSPARSSQRIRKRLEEAFGWAKTVARLYKLRHAIAQRRLAIQPGDGRL